MKKIIITLLLTIISVSAQTEQSKVGNSIVGPKTIEQPKENTKSLDSLNASEQKSSEQKSSGQKSSGQKVEPAVKNSTPEKNTKAEDKIGIPKKENPEQIENGKNSSEKISKKDDTESSENKSSNKNPNDNFNLGASYSVVSMNGKMYQRFSLMPEFKIWKIGVALDLEMFIDEEGNLSTMGWDFSSPSKTAETLTRKIYYVKYGEKGDSFYGKIGAMDNFTLGYGIAMLGYNNTQRYPGIKKTGIELELNNITPIGLSLQAFINNLADFSGDKFVYAGRISVAPLKALSIPVISGLKISGFAAGDRNSYGGLIDSDNDAVPNELDAKPFDATWAITPNLNEHQESVNNAITKNMLDAGYDTTEINEILLDSADMDSAMLSENEEYKALFGYGNKVSTFTIVGSDISLPIINSSFLNLDVYSQIAMNIDDEVKGYGFGAPGVWLSLSAVQAVLEFRHIDGRFQNGYFNDLYELNRARLNIIDSTVILKKNTLDSVLQNGFYGRVGFSVLGLLHSKLEYQNMIGVKYIKNLDGTVTEEDFSPQNIYAELGLDKTLIDMIPKLNEAKIYWGKDNYDNKTEGFFEPTVDTKYGIDVGVNVSGAVVFNYNILYYYEQYGPKRTDVVERKHQYIGISTKF